MGHISTIATTAGKKELDTPTSVAPSGLVSYQFSAGGHELGQALISQLLDRPFDAVGAYSTQPSDARKAG